MGPLLTYLFTGSDLISTFDHFSERENSAGVLVKIGRGASSGAKENDHTPSVDSKGLGRVQSVFG